MATVLTPEIEKRLLDTAQRAAKLAGKQQMEHFGHTVAVHAKASPIDLVTSVDEECDQLITAALKESFPDIPILSEESFCEQNAIHLDETWVVDPLDGTTNYAHGFPHFAVSIAYLKGGQPQVGVVYDPFKKELFYAIRGRGAFLNDAPICVGNVQVLKNALLATGFPYDIATEERNNLDHFVRLATRCHGVRRPGAAALDLAYLACARLDGFWELKLSVWDIAAGVLLIEEAGGQVSDLAGSPLNLAQRRIDLIGTNGSGMHTELIEHLSAVNA